MNLKENNIEGEILISFEVLLDFMFLYMILPDSIH